jgi:hypothetical protein
MTASELHATLTLLAAVQATERLEARRRRGLKPQQPIPEAQAASERAKVAEMMLALVDKNWRWSKAQRAAITARELDIPLWRVRGYLKQIRAAAHRTAKK